MIVNGQYYRTVWMEGDCIKLINQPKLPHEFEIIDCTNHLETAKAIKTMIVRGAGAIGATGAYGLAQAALQIKEQNFYEEIANAKEVLANTRPTAQNLFYGLNAVEKAILSLVPLNKQKKMQSQPQKLWHKRMLIRRNWSIGFRINHSNMVLLIVMLDGSLLLIGAQQYLLFITHKDKERIHLSM